MFKGMNLYGQSNYHQGFPNLAWPHNAIRCDAIVHLPSNQRVILFMQDDYNVYDQVLNLFIFI